MSNLPKSSTFKTSVADYIREYDSKPILLVGGLLDYGYNRSEIAEMTGLAYDAITTIMRDCGYKEISQL